MISEIKVSQSGDGQGLQSGRELRCCRPTSEASTIRWLLDQLVKEVTANCLGAVLASKQLAQLLFVQIIRFYLAAATTVTAGWLRALNDERIAPAQWL